MISDQLLFSGSNSGDLYGKFGIRFKTYNLVYFSQCDRFGV